MNIINMIAIVISMFAFGVCGLFAISGISKDGIKGLKERRKPIVTSFVLYVIFFVVFILTQ